MKHQRHFDQGNRSREALKTQTLVADIERVVQILDSDISAEEEQARVSDRSQAEYPMLARTLAARRDNLRETLAALKKRLSGLPADLLQA
jgi:hypothetical protein